MFNIGIPRNTRGTNHKNRAKLTNNNNNIKLKQWQTIFPSKTYQNRTAYHKFTLTLSVSSFQTI
jgi:hypothetical protein